VNGARFGFLHADEGKSPNARRHIPITERVRTMRDAIAQRPSGLWVIPGERAGSFLGISLDHQPKPHRDLLKFSKDFVIHSLRHAVLTRFGEAAADAFTIMGIASHGTVTVSQRYVHPSSETVERDFEALERTNGRATESLPGARRLELPSTVSVTTEGCE
jgi:hypothetical protein